MTRTTGRQQQVDAFLDASVRGWSGRATRLLATAPGLARYDASTAAVVGDHEAITALLERDPAVATRPDDRRGWPPLVYVCRSVWHHVDVEHAVRLLEVIRQLLAAGADPDAAGVVGHAAGHRQRECLRLLLEAGATLSGTGALAAAIAADDTRAVQLLLDAGADPGSGPDAGTGTENREHADRARDRRHAEPAADPGQHREHADRAGVSGAADPEPGMDLARAGARPDAGTAPKPGEHRAKAGATPGAGRDRPLGYLADGTPRPLPHALAAGAGLPVIEALLEGGADPDAPGPDGRSPLRLAVRRGRPEVVRALLHHAAHDDATEIDRFIGACTHADRAAVGHALDRDPHLRDQMSDEDRWAIVDAADHAGSHAVEVMLEFGFRLDARRDDGATPLHAAAYAGRVNLVRRLAERGADLDARDGRQGHTPLTWAIVGSQERPAYNPDGDWLATVQTLLDAGASIEGIEVPPGPDDVAQLLTAQGVGPPPEIS